MQCSFWLFWTLFRDFQLLNHTLQGELVALKSRELFEAFDHFSPVRRKSVESPSSVWQSEKANFMTMSIVFWFGLMFSWDGMSYSVSACYALTDKIKVSVFNFLSWHNQKSTTHIANGSVNLFDKYQDYFQECQNMEWIFTFYSHCFKKRERTVDWLI